MSLLLFFVGHTIGFILGLAVFLLVMKFLKIL